MAIVSDGWSAELIAGDPADPVKMAGYLTALQTGINSITNAQINASADIAGSKFLAGSIPAGAFAAGAVDTADLAAAAVGWAACDTGTSTGIRALWAGLAERRIQYGSFSVTSAVWSSAATYEKAVVFSSDADEGGASFDSAVSLNIMITIEYTSAGLDAELITAGYYSATSSGFTCKLQGGTAAGGPLLSTFTPSGTIVVHWAAIGDGVPI